MLFDFEKFSNITASVYPGGAYSLEGALSVFRYYFGKYEEHTGRSHPPIKNQSKPDRAYLSGYAVHQPRVQRWPVRGHRAGRLPGFDRQVFCHQIPWL